LEKQILVWQRIEESRYVAPAAINLWQQMSLLLSWVGVEILVSFGLRFSKFQHHPVIFWDLQTCPGKPPKHL
jgi:hypothetical protein